MSLTTPGLTNSVRNKPQLGRNGQFSLPSVAFSLRLQELGWSRTSLTESRSSPGRLVRLFFSPYWPQSSPHLSPSYSQQPSASRGGGRQSQEQRSNVWDRGLWLRKSTCKTAVFSTNGFKRLALVSLLVPIGNFLYNPLFQLSTTTTRAGDEAKTTSLTLDIHQKFRTVLRL